MLPKHVEHGLGEIESQISNRRLHKPLADHARSSPNLNNQIAGLDVRDRQHSSNDLAADLFGQADALLVGMSLAIKRWGTVFHCRLGSAISSIIFLTFRTITVVQKYFSTH
jgi:hypothetical protein